MLNRKHIAMPVIGIFCITLLLSACGAEKDKPRTLQQTIPIYKTEEEYQAQLGETAPLFESHPDDYIVHQWPEEQTGISRPYGICVVDDYAYVCDFDNSCIVKLDMEGNPVASYGEQGTEEGNFSNPTAITCHDGLLYVLDQGNYRVQIFDMEMNYQREESYKPVTFQPRDYLLDIAVDKDGIIFLSVWTNANTYAVYYISDERLMAVNPRISGCLAEYQGEIYAMNTFEYSTILSNGSTSLGATYMSMGANFFLKCTPAGLEQLAELPYKYTPSDFCIVDDMIYAISLHGYERQIDRITMDGQLDSAVHVFETSPERDWSKVTVEPTTFPFYLDVVDDDHIYAVDSLWKTIYYFEKR